MTFQESIIATSIGAFIGFLGALIIFFIKEIWQYLVRKNSTIKNLKMELAYNIILYDNFEEKIQECIEALSNDSRSIYLNLDYDFVGTYFAKQFYQSGLLLKYFHPENMRKWNIMLSQIGSGSEKYVIDCVDDWREQKEIEKNTVYKALNHEKKQIKYAKEMSEYIQNRL